MAAAYFSIKAHQANVQLGDKKDNEMRGVVRAGEGVRGGEGGSRSGLQVRRRIAYEFAAYSTRASHKNVSKHPLGVIKILHFAPPARCRPKATFVFGRGRRGVCVI